MAQINLSKIHFRPYEDDGGPTDFGSGAYNSPARFLDLSTIKFRAWEDPGSSSLGGTDPPDGGGGPGGGIGEIGAYSMHILESTSAEEGAYYDFTTPVTVAYLYAQIYVSQSFITAFSDNVFGVNFGPDVLSLSGTAGDTLDTWQGAFFSRLNASSVDDGNLYLWDYYSDVTDRMQLIADSWNEIEIGYRVNGSTWESSFKVNGVQTAWVDSNTDFPGDLADLEAAVVGMNYNNFNIPYDFYIDTVAISFDNWPSSGGTIAFSDDFESGDFSNWTATFGSPGLGSP